MTDNTDYVMVPKSALAWLFGEEGNFECDPAHYFRGKAPLYWWRSEFRRRIESASPAAVTVGGGVLDRLLKASKEYRDCSLGLPSKAVKFGVGKRFLEAIDAAEKNLAIPPPSPATVGGGEWRALDAAPAYDGVGYSPDDVLVYSPRFGVKTGRAWRWPDGAIFADAYGYSGGDWGITHWMPKPAAPTTTGEGE